MDEVQARARYEELYGTQDDTAWADIVTGAAGEDGEVDWDAFVENLVAPEPAPDPPAEEVPAEEAPSEAPPCDEALVGASLLARLDEQAAQIATQSEQIAQLTGMITAVRSGQARSLYAASTFPQTGTNGTPGRVRLAASAIQVLSNLEQNPGDDSRQALMDHLAANGGNLCVAPVGLIGASLVPPPAAAAPSADDTFLADQWGADTDAIAAIRTIMGTDGITAAAAHAKFCKQMNRG